MQGLAKLRIRATASALLLFAGLGNEAIRYWLLVMGMIGGAASLVFWLSRLGLREDLARAREG